MIHEGIFLFVVLIISAIFLKCFYTKVSGSNDDLSCESDVIFERKFPFFLSAGEVNHDDLFKKLIGVIHQYKTDVERFITSLSTSYQEAARSESIIFSSNKNHPHFSLSSSIEMRIARLAEILELDGFVLQDLLKPIQLTLGLPSPHDATLNSSYCDINSDCLQEEADTIDLNHSYDSGIQVIAHLTRDWTRLGRQVRKSLYEFCLIQLLLRRGESSRYTVLVPGAGVGRLASDLFDFGFHVEANEVSPSMAAAAFHVLHENTLGQIHPFAFDFLMNEVLAEDRYQSIDFPDREMVYDLQISQAYHQGSLSYTLGDFVNVYSSRERSRTFHSVVTCFFIDTATNLYEYILVIRHILKETEGIWINVGPVQWHTNAKLRPSCDELRHMIETMGFTILFWMVDKNPMNYRHSYGDRTSYKSTKFDGFYPLRFVVQRTQHSLDDVDVAQLIKFLRMTKA